MTIDRAMLQAHALRLRRLRNFLSERGAVEVTTPVRVEHAVSDVHLASLPAGGGFLRTSPEYAHKRLLAAGSGDIFELGPVFRGGEHGRRHREEFLMLEWYRVGWTWQRLADEVVEIVCAAAPEREWTIGRCTWSELSEDVVGVDASRLDAEAFRARFPDAPADTDLPELLDWLFALRLQPALPAGRLTVVCDFPACQAALARLHPERPGYAERFEVFAGGLELANGYRELTDPVEQRQRFEEDNRRRGSLGLEPVAIDTALLDALEAGLPECSGVALGVDRLAMAIEGVDDIGALRPF